MSQSSWAVARRAVSDGPERLFFTADQWSTIQAATARIIPTDHDPGAREAGVVRYIDRLLSGLDYVYASADGSGFLDIEGKEADAWRARIDERREAYREGIVALQALSHATFGHSFEALSDAQQDQILEELSGQPKPTRVTPGGPDERAGGGGPPPSNQPVNDEDLSFFDMLVFHTRQGFYSDPAYGGNANRVGWDVIGYPGPETLAQTMDGTYTTRAYLPSATETGDQEGQKPQ
jgi:gluconate 2-dehydrogenase gamma chain